MLEGMPAMVLALLLAAPTAYLVIISTYVLVLSVGAWLYRPRVDREAPPLRMALLIPAHNEAGHLHELLGTAKQADYPADCFKIFVIADNCTDDTAVIARRDGAVVFERQDPELRGKGPALDWTLKHHSETFAGYDAIALVDADMYIDANFLRELSASLACEGVQVVQGLNTVAHPEKTWRTALGYVGFSVINHLRPAGRCWLGGTGELKGSGMAFRTPLLLRYGWPSHALAEDVEFSKMLFLDGIRVHYNPRARVTSEIPTHVASVKVQQQRWERGKLDLLKRYFGKFLVNFLRRPSLARLDALLDIMVPPQSVLALLYLGSMALWCFVSPVWAGVVLACLLADAFCIFSALLQTRAPARIWFYLCAVPVLLVWKLPFYCRMLLTRSEAGWQRTPRKKEVE